MTKPRCDKHRNEAQAPALCHTCQRIIVEHDIVTRVVDVLTASGFQLREQYEDEWQDREALLTLLFDLDEAFLVCGGKEGSKGGWVRFVFGNDGWDVICDYTVNLESVLEPVTQYADTLQP